MNFKDIEYINEKDVEDLEQETIKINRVTKVAKGGRTFSFSAFVVVGNKNGVVGLGFGKARDVMGAVTKASQRAKKRLVKINFYKHTIPYETTAKYCSSKIKLIPASEGTGVIAGGNVRLVLEYAGVKNIFSKTYGSRNAINSAKAALVGLINLQSAFDLAKDRDIPLEDFYQ